MTTCLGKSCSFGFMGVCQILFVSFFPFAIEGRSWGVIVLIPDHCLSIYVGSSKASPTTTVIYY